MKLALNYVKKLGDLWEKFWFYSPHPKQMRAFRTLLGMVLFLYNFSRSFDLALFYSDSGILKLSVFPDVMAFPYRYSLLEIFTGSTALWTFHVAFLVSLLTLTFGFFPESQLQWLLFCTFPFFIEIWRLPMALMPWRPFLIYLCFADYKAKAQGLASILGSMAFRFCQLQVCVIYGYSGLEKLRGVKWWQGEAVWDVLANFQVARWDFSWVASFPLLIVIATYTTVLWEIYFPVLVWIRPCTRWVLLFGVMLHLGIGLAMNIPFFASIMMATYVLFLDSKALDGAHTMLHRLWRRLKVKVVLNRSDESYV